MAAKIEDPKDRLNLLLAGLSGKKDVAELCREAGISRELYYRWLERVKEKALEALEQKDPGPGRKESSPEEAKKLESRIEKLAKKLAKAQKEKSYLGLVVKTAQKIIKRNAWGTLPRGKKNSARVEKPVISTGENGMTPDKMDPGK